MDEDKAAKEGAAEKPVENAGQPEAGDSQEAHSSKLSAVSDQMLRLQAEFDNFKKRTAKEKEALSHSAEAKFMLRMLPVYEEISLAEKEAGRLPEGEVKKGIMLVLGKFRESFQKEGLQEMRLVGEKFDPFRHETAMREESDKPEGTIVRVIQKGYVFRGSVLRHAMVSVSSGKKQQEAQKPEAKPETGE